VRAGAPRRVQERGIIDEVRPAHAAARLASVPPQTAMKHALNLGLATLFTSCLLAGDAHAHLAETLKLLASDGVPGDRFGAGAALEGPLAAIGAPHHVHGGASGAVYVYLQSSTAVWPEVAELNPTGAGLQDDFGAELALGGPYLAVSAPKASADAGAVYVFNGFGATWSQTQVLTASDAGPGHSFGRSVDLDGDTLVVGAPGNEAAYVFRLVAGTWVEEQKLTLAAGLPGDLFGRSVALHGDELVAGAPGDDTDALDGGSAYLFERSGSTWTQIHRFGSATPGAGDAFGQSVCIGDLFAGVGAPFDDDLGADSGAAHRFRRNGPGSWLSEGTLTAPAAPTFAGDHLGQRIVLDTDLFAVGAPDGDLQGAGSGVAQTFSEIVGNFYGDVLFPSDNTAGNALGSSLGISSCWLISGTPMDDDLGENAGAAYIFLDAPAPQLYCIPGISGKGCVATLSTAGIPSASQASGFTVMADGVEGGINGLFYYGTTGKQQVAWGNGTSFQCVVPPVLRMGTITSTGPSGFSCAGVFAQDLNAVWCSTCPLPAKNPGAGEEILLQLWYRDPTNTSNQSTSLSNAAWISICP